MANHELAAQHPSRRRTRHLRLVTSPRYERSDLLDRPADERERPGRLQAIRAAFAAVLTETFGQFSDVPWI